MTVHRHSATTVVETDMRSFEGAFNEDWCHILGRPCGGPPSRSRRQHFGWMNDGQGITADGRCSGCGRKVCPDCLGITRGRNA